MDGRKDFQSGVAFGGDFAGERQLKRVSELVAKPVISIFDARIVGTIGNIFFDSGYKKGLVLSIFSDDESDAEEKYVAFSSLVSLDNDAAVIKSSDCVTFAWNTHLKAPNPINTPAFSQDGKFLGIVRDLELDGSKVANFIVGESSIAASTLLSHSASILVFNDSGAPLKPPPRKKIKTKNPPPQRIQLHYETPPPNPTPNEQPKNNQPLPELQPTLAQPISELQPTAAPPTPDAQPKSAQPDSDAQPKSAQPVSELQPTTDQPTFDSQPAKSYQVFDSQPAPTHPIPDVQPTNSDSSIGVPQLIPQSATVVSRSPVQSGDVNSRFDFLLGKLLEKNIYSDSGTLLIHANTLITQEVIAICKQESRLVQLALHSKG